MISVDAVPFLVLAAVAIIAGITGNRKGTHLGLVLFCLGGLLPLLSYISNAEKLPFPATLEMVGFFAAVPLLLAASFASKRTGNAFFWVAAVTSIVIAVLINLMIAGRLRIPV